MSSLKFLVGGVATLAVASSVHAAIIDSFDATVGRFSSDPDTSGSTIGLSETNDGVGPSTAARTAAAGEVFEGAGALRLSLTSGTYYTATIAAGGTPQTRTGFVLRLLSGGGTPANNVAQAPAATTFSFYAATAASNVQIAPIFDDGATSERAPYQTLVNDGTYRLYTFDLTAANFVRFAGAGGTAALDAATVTLDSLAVTSTVDQTAAPVVLLIDSVQFNTAPEPASLAALGLAGLTLVRRRRA